MCRLTLVDQGLRHFLTFLRPPHQSNSDSCALLRQPAIIILVCNTPNFTQYSGRELCTPKDLECGISSENSNLLRVGLEENLGNESEFGW
jgi:hypothetical protein